MFQKRKTSWFNRVLFFTFFTSSFSFSFVKTMESIAQIKLKEIQNQRKKLLEHYEVVSNDAKSAP